MFLECVLIVVRKNSLRPTLVTTGGGCGNHKEGYLGPIKRGLPQNEYSVNLAKTSCPNAHFLHYFVCNSKKIARHRVLATCIAKNESLASRSGRPFFQFLGTAEPAVNETHGGVLLVLRNAESVSVRVLEPGHLAAAGRCPDAELVLLHPCIALELDARSR